MESKIEGAICKCCNEIIPNGHVQQGGMHMGCYNKQIEVFKICADGTCCYDENFPENHEEYEITKEMMAYGDFYYLPEFEGF